MEIFFSEAEMDRLKVLGDIPRGLLGQQEGALQLGISTRQVRRLLRRISAEGSRGIKRRSLCGSNRSHSVLFKSQVLHAVRHRYADFGPTFASEKLLENEVLKINSIPSAKWGNKSLWMC